MKERKELPQGFPGVGLIQEPIELGYDAPDFKEVSRCFGGLFSGPAEWKCSDLAWASHPPNNSGGGGGNPIETMDLGAESRGFEAGSAEIHDAVVQSCAAGVFNLAVEVEELAARAASLPDPSSIGGAGRPLRIGTNF
jgi:hypothetical protein